MIAPTDLRAAVLDALPQTQCTRCGYPDCAAYAAAVADEVAPINQCPPGGQEGVRRLARLTQRSEIPLSADHGVEGPLTLAVIDEDWCIGCTLCLDACPTDAIAGAHKRMHTVIEPHCTGCELCIPVCPVDCIEMTAVSGALTGWAAWSQEQADHARQRHASGQLRRARTRAEHEERLERKARDKLADLPGLTHSESGLELDRKRAVIQAALDRARARKEHSKP